MQKALVMVRYSLSGDRERFRADMDKAARAIAIAPGLVWKIWGFDVDSGAGVSSYLFESMAHANAFIASPMIAGLKNRPDVTDVSVAVAPVDHRLSEITGAQPALSALAMPAAA